MSRWTHAAGIIRIDDYGLVGTFEEGEIRNADGTLNIRAMIGRKPRNELQVLIWTNPEHRVAAYTVSVFGDLRDYEDVDGLVEWFQTVCGKFTVRDAVITVRNEIRARTWTYKKKKKYS